jgi:large subunit ribosomal protein L18
MAAKKKKLTPREKSKIRVRQTLKGTDERPRVCIFRSSKHCYAQLISDESSKTFVSASTLEKEVVDEISKIETEGKPSSARSTKSVAAAKAVGIVLARRSKAANISSVVFDRNGFSYTGRVQAIADGAREGGLQF